MMRPIIKPLTSWRCLANQHNNAGLVEGDFQITLEIRAMLANIQAFTKPITGRMKPWTWCHRLRAYSGKVRDDRRLAAGVKEQAVTVCLDIWSWKMSVLTKKVHTQARASRKILKMWSKSRSRRDIVLAPRKRGLLDKLALSSKLLSAHWQNVQASSRLLKLTVAAQKANVWAFLWILIMWWKCRTNLDSSQTSLTHCLCRQT